MSNILSVLVILLFIYYVALVIIAKDKKGYIDEIPNKKLTMYFIIPFSYFVVSLFETIKEIYE